MNSRNGGPHAPSSAQIVEYSPSYGDAFARLNREWLERYFRVEPIDEAVLSDPQSKVLADGGVILYAVIGGDAVGTVALKHSGAGVYELTKMAVTAAAQGRGLGRLLMDAAIVRFADIDGKKLFLESHDSLKPALALYESAGFRHSPRPHDSDYQRSNVYMEYRPASPEAG